MHGICLLRFYQSSVLVIEVIIIGDMSKKKKKDGALKVPISTSTVTAHLTALVFLATLQWQTIWEFLNSQQI